MQGAEIITFDICEPIDTVADARATEDDLNDTVEEVETLDCRIVARKSDVLDPEAVQAVLDEGVAEPGRVDIVLANAGITSVTGEKGARPQPWHDAIDIMSTGAMHTCEAATPAMLEHGQGGSIVITSSNQGSKGRCVPW